MDFPFATVTGWSSHERSPSAGQRRSLTSFIMRTPTPKPSRMSSTVTAETPRIVDMEAALSPRASRDDEDDLSTLPDPRSWATSPAVAEVLGSPHHAELDDEVTTLSTKLINAMNHQTSLDDNLSVTRLELERAHAKIRKLEERIASQQEVLSGDVWVRRKTAEAERTNLLHRLAEEKRAKQAAEEQRKRMEHELETLTAALFEEANKMVRTAKEEGRSEQDALHRKNDQLRGRLADTESLLKSQQEQLIELKLVMEQMGSERDDQTCLTTPSSPGPSKRDSGEEDGNVDSRRYSGAPEPLSPSYPTSFTYLVQPVLRTDLTAFKDFRDLLRTSKRLSAQSMTGMRPLQPAAAVSAPSSASASPAVSCPQSPNASASTANSVPAFMFPPLRDTKFYKRALMEDVEPTLRLDLAPGLSWLARRTVLSAMTDGSLVVEPVHSPCPDSKLVNPQTHACSLCGECRLEEDHLRTHRFRTSESSSQQYPLCKYCLNRVRSTCDFLGFLRIVKDGHWRADDDDAEKAAWEESVRLREQMFWARIGGGVLPAGYHHVAEDTIVEQVDGTHQMAEVLELNQAAFSGNSCVCAELGTEPIEHEPEGSPARPSMVISTAVETM